MHVTVLNVTDRWQLAEMLWPEDDTCLFCGGYGSFGAWCGDCRLSGRSECSDCAAICDVCRGTGVLYIPRTWLWVV